MPDAFFPFADRAGLIAGCVTRTPLLRRQFAGAEGTRQMMLFLPEAGQVRVMGALRGASIQSRILLRAPGDGVATEVIDYAHALLDRNGVELLAWHFHPDSSLSRVMTPHLHVSAALRPHASSGERGMIPLDKRHLPTGVVSLAAFVRMLIEEFGVEPLARDWQARLAEA